MVGPHVQTLSWGARVTERMSPKTQNIEEITAMANRGGRKLLGAFAKQDGGDGSQYDLEIKPQRPIIDIAEIHFDPVIEACDFVAPARLPLAGDTGFHTEPTAVRDLSESLNLIKGERAGADQTHVPREDVDELWQLIDTEFS